MSALVKPFLLELASGETDIKRLKREERALRERITTFRESAVWDELHHHEI